MTTVVTTGTVPDWYGTEKIDGSTKDYRYNVKMWGNKKILEEKNKYRYPVSDTLPLHRICVYLDITAIPVPAIGHLVIQSFYVFPLPSLQLVTYGKR
jgi:hypothetical protein